MQRGFWPAEIKFQSNPVQLVAVESALRLNFDLYECIHGNNTAELLKSVQVNWVCVVLPPVVVGLWGTMVLFLAPETAGAIRNESLFANTFQSQWSHGGM